MAVITTWNIAHNMSASAEGHNQPYFINSENLCGAVCLYWTVNGSWSQKHVFVLSIKLFFWKTPHVECTPLTKVLFFKWKIFSAVWNLTPTDGCLTHAYVGEQCVHLSDHQALLHQRFIFLSAGGNLMGKNANNGADSFNNNGNHLVCWTGNKLFKIIYHTNELFQN